MNVCLLLCDVMVSGLLYKCNLFDIYWSSELSILFATSVLDCCKQSFNRLLHVRKPALSDIQTVSKDPVLKHPDF